MNKGCVDCNTEYFNGETWKPIYLYKEGDLVLQYDVETEEASLVKPIEFIKEPCDNLYFFQDTRLCQSLSDEHKVIFYSDNDFDVQTMQTIYKAYNEGKFNGKFKTTFNFHGPGINMSDEELEIFIDNYTFNKALYCCNEKQFGLIFNKFVEGIPVVMDEAFANFVQFVFTIHGCGSYIAYTPEGCTVDAYATGYAELEKDTRIYKVKPADNYKYCFTVPTRALVLRKNGKIFITGNSSSYHKYYTDFEYYKMKK